MLTVFKKFVDFSKLGTVDSAVARFFISHVSGGKSHYINNCSV